MQIEYLCVLARTVVEDRFLNFKKTHKTIKLDKQYTVYV